MATIQRFEDLEIWKKSRVLSNNIYPLTFIEPIASDFRIKDQMRGSVGSIMDNIAEGFERGTKAEFIVFLGYAKGSCGELRSQLYRILDRNYIDQETFNEMHAMAVKISSMLQKLIMYLQKTPIKGVRSSQTLNVKH